MVRFLSLLVGLFFVFAQPLVAQERVWVQVEANPTLSESEAAVRRYSASIENVNGVRLRGFDVAVDQIDAVDPVATFRQWHG